MPLFVGVSKPNRGPDAGVRFDGRKGYWLDEDGKQAKTAPKSKKGKHGGTSPRKDQPEESPDEEFLGPFVESCVGDAGQLGMVFNPGKTALPPPPRQQLRLTPCML